MHIVIATLYGLVAWISLLAYAVIVDGPWVKVLVSGPLVVSGIIVVVIGLDYTIIFLRPTLARFARWLWRCLGTIRL